MLRLSLIFFLFCSLSFGQNNTINNLSVDSRDNGTIIELQSTKTVDLKNITAWYSSEWFYLTVYDAKSDSTKLLNTDFSNPIRKIEVANSEESTQIALQFNESIESFEIMPPLKKGVSLILRFPQEDIKNDLANTNDLEEFAEFNEPAKNNKFKDSLRNKGNPANKLMPFLGMIVAVSDIANPGIFLVGTLIGLSSLFF
ncbi:MAG: hypothetical protein VX703_00900 [Candidatus Neomarinimicrobiota bacterium]|nr:hypothetical protein [Candidatus Neomarinimicrobiota bacterium]